MNESNRGVDADRQKKNAKRNARITGQTLGALADRDAPVNQEQPNAVRQMPYSCRDADDVNDKDPGAVIPIR